MSKQHVFERVESVSLRELAFYKDKNFIFSFISFQTMHSKVDAIVALRMLLIGNNERGPAKLIQR